MTDAEKAERERRRQFSGGLSSYRWLPDGRRICGMIDGTVYLFDRVAGSLRALTAEAFGRPISRFRPGGRYLSYVRAGDLYLFDLSLGHEERLTHDASRLCNQRTRRVRRAGRNASLRGPLVVAGRSLPSCSRASIARDPGRRIRYEFTANELVAVAQRYPYAGADECARRSRRIGSAASHSVRWIEYRTSPTTILRE